MIPISVLRVCRVYPPAKIELLTGGLINQTFKVVGFNKKIVIQRVNPMYSISSIARQQSLQDYLRVAGLSVPKLIRILRYEQDLYRVFEFIEHDGLGYDKITPQIATCLGLALANLHKVLMNFPERLTIPHREFHNTPSFMKKLAKVAASQPEKAALVQSEIDFILQEFEALIAKVPVKIAITHGDPKIYNFLFKDNRLVGIVDWDEVSFGNVYLEIGDALRNWSLKNKTRFDSLVYKMALLAYTSKSPFHLNARIAANATKLITMELAARFLTDYFEESYFAWNSQKYTSAAEHNLKRAKDTLEYYINLQNALKEA